MVKVAKAAAGALLALTLSVGMARANDVDTLTGLTLGDTIGCNYTFSDGSPSIPCASDTVAADGTVSFVKPNVEFDGLEYFDETTGEDIADFLVLTVPLLSELTPGTEYPILVQPVGGDFKVTSFFDVFVELSIDPFNDAHLDLDGTYEPGDTFEFTGGTSPGLPDITIPGYTGPVEIIGFDKVSAVPEPSSLLLFAGGAAALLRRRRGSRLAARKGRL